MFASRDNSSARLRLSRAAAWYLFISVFCLAASRIYELFGYGMTSVYMERMFFVPLFAGALVYVLLRLFCCHVPRAAQLLYNSSVALITTYCFVRGVVEISGRNFAYTALYLFPAVLFAGSAVLMWGIGRIQSSGDAGQH